MKMKTIKKIGILALIIGFSGFLIYAVSGDKNNRKFLEGTSSYFPESVDFAGENAPLQITDVKERLDRELIVNANLHGSTILILKRANRVFPIIEPILKKNGIPDDFKYVPLVEAGFSEGTSIKGAKGLWQQGPGNTGHRWRAANDVDL